MTAAMNITAIQIHIDGRQVYPADKPSRGLTEAARTLGVTREHLSRVLHGHRVSARLLRRFSALTHPTPTHRP